METWCSNSTDHTLFFHFTRLPILGQSTSEAQRQGVSRLVAVRHFAYDFRNLTRRRGMDAQSVAVNMLTGVVTGTVTGVAIGFFGVWSALKQFRLQQAFGRQLDWYEKTIQSMFEFLYLNESIVFGIEQNDFRGLKDAIENSRVPLKEFQKAVNNSLLYADRDMYLRLKGVGAEMRSFPLLSQTPARWRDRTKHTQNC